MLEKVQKTIAKSLQGLHWRTHDEIVRGLLGWYTVNGYINKMKLMFVCKLVNMKSTSIVKFVFLHEIYNCILCPSTGKSITMNLYNVLNEYGLIDCVLSYLQGGSFPDKFAWKAIVREKVYQSEELKWKNGLFRKDASRYWEVQRNLRPNIIYHIIKTNPNEKKKLIVLIKALTIIQNDEDMLCTLCQCVVNDSVEHVLLRCEGLLDERCRMWDDILDALDVHIEAKLLNLEDHDILRIMLGKQWNGFKCIQDSHDMLCTVATFLNRFNASLC